MTLQELANLGQSQGFRILDNQIVGIHKGYAFRLAMKNKSDSDIIEMSVVIDRNMPGKVRKGIKNSLPKGAKVNITTPGNILLLVTCPTESSQDAYTVTVNALDVITENLSSAKKPISNPAKCPICRKEDCDSAALANGNFVPVHRQCAVEENQKEADSADRNQQSGNYLTGIIGAIIGAIVGCIPTIILMFAMQYEYSWLYLLIPMASFAGYKLLRGRRGILASVIVTIASVLAFVIMQLTIYYIYLMMDYDGIVFSEVVVWYFSEIPLTDKLSDIWFGAIFLILGIAGSFKMMGTTNDDRIRAARANIDSIIPLTGQADAGVFDNTDRTRSSSYIDPWLK